MTAAAVAAPLDLPTRRDEAWRHAPHRTLAGLVFGPPADPERRAIGSIDDLVPALDGPRIVVVNGIVDPERSRFVAPAGVTVSTFAEAASQHSPLVAAHLDVGEPADAFAALTLAHGVDGAVVEVAAGVGVAAPIHVVVVAAPGATGDVSSAGVVVHVGAASTATVVETRIGVGTQFGGSSVRTSVTLDRDATLEHIVLQDLPTMQVHLGHCQVTQAAGSTYLARSFNLGSSYGRLAHRVSLDGQGALADLSGLFSGSGEQTLDHQVDVTHRVADCSSRQWFRGVLDDESTGVFNGGIDVRPGADGSDAAQSNDNLLLSTRAAVNTQPRLEILADEVSCKHGATVGQLDDTALYYLRTRGVPLEAARRMLIGAFAARAVEGVGLAAVRTWITARLGLDADA